MTRYEGQMIWAQSQREARFEMAPFKEVGSGTPGPSGGRLCPTCGKEVHGDPGQGRLHSDWDVSHDPSWTNRIFP